MGGSDAGYGVAFISTSNFLPEKNPNTIYLRELLLSFLQGPGTVYHQVGQLLIILGAPPLESQLPPYFSVLRHPQRVV